VLRRALILLACGLVLAGCSGGKTTSPHPQTVVGTLAKPVEVKGNPTAGKAVFTGSAGCAGCHTLKDAGAKGTVGPNLDQKKPPLSLVVDRVTHGKGVMPAFGDSGQLTKQQIADVAAYVVQATSG
jgi:mono/diheme cytochrome c family protein